MTVTLGKGKREWQELECFPELAREGDVSEPCREKRK